MQARGRTARLTSQSSVCVHRQVSWWLRPPIRAGVARTTTAPSPLGPSPSELPSTKTALPASGTRGEQGGVQGCSSPQSAASV